MSTNPIQHFNKELNLMLESKPPVSKQRMSAITKAAMRAVKFYKHVVHSVERLLCKCPTEYKLPGLYVIDAIVRHSRHQFTEKDVFGPRFARNIVPTFRQVAVTSTEKDIGLVVRLLNLWQKNEVFPSELIQALMDVVANPRDKAIIQSASQVAGEVMMEQTPTKSSRVVVQAPATFVHQTNGTASKTPPVVPPADNSWGQEGGGGEGESPSDDPMKPDLGNELVGSVAQLLSEFQSDTNDPELRIAQLRQLQDKIVEHSALLANGNMMDPEALGHLHMLMQELSKKTAAHVVHPEHDSNLSQNSQKDSQPECPTETTYDNHIPASQHTLQSADMHSKLQHLTESMGGSLEEGELDPETQPMATPALPAPPPIDPHLHRMLSDQPENGGREEEREGRYDSHKQRKRRSPVSPGVSPDTRRRRSRSRERHEKRRRRDEEDRARHERKKKDLPPLVDGHVCILSRTVFVGHLHKQTTEVKLRSEMEELGSIESLNCIPPRGCAFVTFDQRKSAARAVDKLNGRKIDQKEVKVAWAPNRGIKDSANLSKFWDEKAGCTYLPEESLPLERSEREGILAGGGELDMSSVSVRMLEVLAEAEKIEDEREAARLALQTQMAVSTPAVSIAPPPPPPFHSTGAFPPPPPPPGNAFLGFPPPPPPLIAPTTSLSSVPPPPPPSGMQMNFHLPPPGMGAPDASSLTPQGESSDVAQTNPNSTDAESNDMEAPWPSDQMPRPWAPDFSDPRNFPPPPWQRPGGFPPRGGRMRFPPMHPHMGPRGRFPPPPGGRPPWRGHMM